MENKSYKHWLTIACLCGLAASSIGICQNTPGVFYTPVSESLGVLRGTFAMHATLQSLAIAVTALFMPKLMKKVKYKLLIIIGVVMSVLSTIGMAYSTNVYMFYVLGIIRGIGSGLFAIMPITTIITNWFKEKHGLATSIALSFSGLAGAICSPVLSSCINTLGWQKAYFVMAALIAICALPALIFKVTITPAEVGLLPYGGDEAIERKVAEKKAFNYLTLSFILMGCMTVMHTSITGISQHLSSYSVSLGLDAALGATMMSLTMVGNIFSKLAFGVLSDKIGPVKSAYTMQVTNIISLVMIMVGGNLHLVPLQLAGALLFGSIYSVGAVGIPLLTKKFFGAENFSSTFAIIGFLTSVGSASSLTLIGYLYDFTHTYVYMFIIAIIFHIVNMINITFINKKQA